jgi:FAS-associated factor 2
LALQQFTSMTDQDLESALPILQRSQWNVQVRVPSFGCCLGLGCFGAP